MPTFHLASPGPSTFLLSIFCKIMHPPLHCLSHSSPSVPSLPSLRGPFQANALAWRNRLSKQPCRSSLRLGLYIDFVSFRIPSSFSLGHGAAAGATAKQQCAGLVRPGLSRCFFTLFHTYVLCLNRTVLWSCDHFGDAQELILRLHVISTPVVLDPVLLTVRSWQG